ncbi:MAG: hypothetical protein M3N31_05270 [Actinomycetota bacterium]|nr:hypothetical protein [Actinomycetota bacterium]
MSLWILPLLVVAAGLVPVAILVLRAAEEAGNLGRQLRELGALRPALVEVRTAGRQLRASMEELRRT